MFSRMFLLAVLALSPQSLMAQVSAPKDTTTTQFCRTFVYSVPNDTTVRDTTGVAKLLPKTDSTCVRSTASRPRSQSAGAPRATPRVPRAQPTPRSEPVETPRMTEVRVAHDPLDVRVTHSDTTVVKLDLSGINAGREPTRFDRFFAHVGRNKWVYGVVTVGLTAWCIAECGGDNTQRTTVIVNR